VRTDQTRTICVNNKCVPVLHSDMGKSKVNMWGGGLTRISSPNPGKKRHAEDSKGCTVGTQKRGPDPEEKKGLLHKSKSTVLGCSEGVNRSRVRWYSCKKEGLA